MIDSALYWTSQSLILADWSQTRMIATSSKYYEMNPILGRHPTLTEVNVYFGGMLLGNHLIEEVTDKRELRKIRRMFRIGAIVMQAATVINNKRIGIGFKF